MPVRVDPYTPISLFVLSQPTVAAHALERQVGPTRALGGQISTCSTYDSEDLAAIDLGKTKRL